MIQIPGYLLHILILICIYAILGMGLNLQMGFTGLPNLGLVAFFGIGAYSAALTTLSGMPYWVGLLCSCVLSGFIGFLIAIPALRLRGGYLVIVTIGIAQIFQSSFRNLTWLTRGPMGLPAIPKPDLLFLNFNTLESFLVLAFLFAFLTFFILQRIVKSPYGRVLRAIKEDEIATSAMGILKLLKASLIFLRASPINMRYFNFLIWLVIGE